MIRYQPYPRGTNVYSEYVGESLPCEHGQCEAKACFVIKGPNFDDDPSHYCAIHLEIKQFIFSGQCDGCNRRSFEPWLCLMKRDTGQNLYKLCKQCCRPKRRKQ